MQPVRVPAALAVLLVALGTAGCSGFSIGVRQDKEDREALLTALRTKQEGSRFPARELLRKDWTRLFVFRGGIATQAIEDRIGIPFPQSGEETPKATPYLVFADREAVVAAFSYEGPGEVDPRCLLAERVPLDPGTPLTVIGSGPARLTTVAGAARCG